MRKTPSANPETCLAIASQKAAGMSWNLPGSTREVW